MSTDLTRRALLLAIPGAGLLAACGTDGSGEPAATSTGSGEPAATSSGSDSPSNTAMPLAGVSMVVAKSPTCGCCGGWIEHAEAAGANVTIEHPDDLAATFADVGIDWELQACHLTTVADALFVGHIPLRFVAEYLADPPSDLRGLAVPGMPTGTPGMEAGDTLDPYDVIALHTDGSTSVHAQVTTLADQEA
ncbi:MAG: DUF411 domain-containing protein [Beutenbergiaceae bacterium]